MWMVARTNPPAASRPLLLNSQSKKYNKYIYIYIYIHASGSTLDRKPIRTFLAAYNVHTSAPKSTPCQKKKRPGHPAEYIIVEFSRRRGVSDVGKILFTKPSGDARERILRKEKNRAYRYLFIEYLSFSNNESHSCSHKKNKITLHTMPYNAVTVRGTPSDSALTKASVVDGRLEKRTGFPGTVAPANVACIDKKYPTDLPA